MPDSADISRAIEHHLGLWWTDEARDAIRADVGSDGLRLIEEIVSAASSGAIWLDTSHDRAYDDAQSLLRTRYPFLSPAAVMRVANYAAYGWK